MPEVHLRRATDIAHDRACRELEASVARIAKLVLHASALADRMDTMAGPDVPTRPDRSERVGVLRAAVTAGQVSMRRLVGASLASTDVPPARVPR